MRIVNVELDKDLHLKCSSPPELAINEGDFCVMDRGANLEFGRAVRIWEADVATQDSKDMPRVLRRATLQDHSKARENAVYLKMASESCRKKVRELKLDMRVVCVRLSFDRKVITIEYTSEERIQFRDLVKDLATQLNARIEMQQMGIRDAAGVVGGMGVCGRQLCCRAWLHEFEAVSVRMAKNQRLSLNPNTISGMCGRLKCCLRYENDCYAELLSHMPRDGAVVSCPAGKGCVVEKNILAQKVKVRLEGDRVQEFGAAEVTTLKSSDIHGQNHDEDEDTDKQE